MLPSPALVVKNNMVSWHGLPIIIPVPMVEGMGSVFQFQCRMDITGFPECRIFWLDFGKPTY